MTPEQIEEIRERHKYRLAWDQSGRDIAALLDHCADRDRLFDLVRHQRAELFEADLISMEEYEKILVDGQTDKASSVRRLESYDEMRQRLSRYAALTPEVVETLCEACDEAMMAATEEADNAYHRQARRNNALMRHDQFAAARAVMESLK